jgi:DNA helicase-2/ATP-dependent DNA helicase PcrA
LSVSPSPAAGHLERLLSGLTPQQAAAVTHGPGPQVIYAGPGAGKTRTLIARVEYLLATGMAAPREIVAVTFTNNAARECAVRLEASIGLDAVRAMQICTFHALCSRILRQHAPLAGRRSNFTIYDQRAVLGVIEYVLADELRGDVREQLEAHPSCSAEEIREEISLAKNRLWTPSFFARHSTNPHAPLIATAWSALDEELASSNAVDFDDLLCLAVRVIGEHPELQAHYRARWHWLMVDEVQDTCYAQMGLLRLLAQPAGNLTIVGDRDQALYSFRGAEPRNLLSFPALFPGRHEVLLGVNFRSREEIVRAAEALIGHNRHRPAIEFSAARGPGGMARARGFQNEYAEAGWIAKEVSCELAAGVPAEEILVIARASFGTSPVQRALSRAGIKHHILGSLGLFERADIKDALAYLALLENPDDAIALRRAIAAPRREVGSVTCAAVVAHARTVGINLLEACARAKQIQGVRARACENLAAFGQAMLALRAQHGAGAGVSETITRALMLPGGLVHHHQELRDHPPSAAAGEQATETLALLRAVRDSSRLYERQAGSGASPRGFLERAVGLHGDRPAISEEGVRVSTIHRAKGTEARSVFLCACEEDITPSRYAIATGSLLALEEERCAFYVGMTRPEDRLTVTWAAVRKGRPTAGRSRFLAEAGL